MPIRISRESRLAAGLLLPVLAARGEDQGSYQYEDYAEEGGRIHVRTHGLFVEKEITPWLALKGNYVYDGISGATPLGAPPLPGENTVAKVTIEDIRRGGFFEPTLKLANQTFAPQIAYSEESDYRSVGVSLTHSIEFNEKNTTLTWAVSHSFDRILPNPGEAILQAENKDVTDVMLGVSQLLGPDTIFTANVTIGYATGYLNDPYKRVLFDDFPYYPGFPYTVFPENRPNHKLREVGYLSIQHFFEPLNGALEGSYRLHHDDWDIIANTLDLKWHQKLGRWLTLSPSFRYHTQTAASFYGTHFPGDPSLPPDDPFFIPFPQYYSADYRISALDTYTYGLSAELKIKDRVSLHVAYQRYEMFGTDGQTAANQYPKANIWTGGLSVWF